jgi:hypothetical protein
MERQRRISWARWLGVASSLALVLLWVVLGVNSRNFPASTPGDFWVRTLIMAGFALVGLAAAYFRIPLLMLVIFAIAFIPVGLYLLGVPSYARLIGVFDLLYLVSAVGLLLEKYAVGRKQEY